MHPLSYTYIANICVYVCVRALEQASERASERESERARERDNTVYANMYIENMNRETQAHRDNGKKRTHEKHTHTHNVKVYISLPWCVRGTLLDLRLERGSINSFRALLRLF